MRPIRSVTERRGHSFPLPYGVDEGSGEAWQNQYEKRPASTDAGLFHILLRGMYPPEPTWNQYGSKLEPEVRIGKVRIGKDRIGSAAAKPRHPLDSSFSLTDDEKALKMEKNGGRG